MADLETGQAGSRADDQQRVPVELRAMGAMLSSYAGTASETDATDAAPPRRGSD